MTSQDYVVTEKVLTDGDIPVTIYTNKITGLRIVIAYVECPIVKGDLVFATEAFDDDGLPHTLEHLIFLGSEDYPYKGVLDLLANRCLARGTNACTDTDNTRYELATAGTDGFLTMLPIYMDHLLYPTLTESAFVTEVHHINGEGEDAGVVYCEMQAIENTGDSRCYIEMLRSAYPGKCGYKSETGGALHNLRTSTNNEKCRSYHKQFYHAKNLCIIVTGPVNSDDLIRAIKPIEDKIVAKGHHTIEFDRPWMTPVEPLEKSVTRKIEYSCETDDDGIVNIAFRGPNAIQDYQELVAISILLEYLNSTAVSPIQRDFVECEEPYCSSVCHSIIENSTSLFYFQFDSVGKSHLDKVEERLFQLLESIVSGKEKIDMGRMSTTISRKIVKILSIAEESPHSLILGPVVGHFLYGTGFLKERSQEIPVLKILDTCDAKFWCDLMSRYMVGDNARHVCIVGQPSPTFMKTMAEAEENRIAVQKENLKDDLENIAAKVKDACRMNERPAPQDMLTSVVIPSTDNIKFHPIERVILTELPFRFHYDSIKTNFITVLLLMDTSCLSKSERLYLPLLSEILLETSINRDGVLIPYEQIVTEMFADTVSHGTGLGIALDSPFRVGAFSMFFSVVMQVEIDKYEKAVKWFDELLFNTVFTPERIKTTATRMVSDISQYKRSGGKVTSSLLNGLTYQSNSNQWATNFMRQHKFLKNVLQKLKEDPDSVQSDITKVRDSINSPSNLLVHVTLNKDKVNIARLHEPWLRSRGFCDQSKGALSRQIYLDKIIKCRELVDFYKDREALIVGIGSVESNYLTQIVKTCIDRTTHPDLPAVQVLINYLTQLEGPLWRQIRGPGLTYSYSISLAPYEGLIYFQLYKSTRLVEAYDKTVEVVNSYISGEEAFDDTLLDSAKSSLIYEYINREKSAAGKSLQSLIAYLRDLDINFNRDIIRKISEVTKEDLRRVGPIYLRPLFDNESRPNRRAAICCPPLKTDEIRSGLKQSFVSIKFEEDPIINSID